MKQYADFGFLDKCWGVLVGLGIFGKAVITKPSPKTLQQRLAMLPTDKLPLQAAVNIYWNDQLIPFVEAQSKADLAQAVGLIHGHLRLAQIELTRYLGTGRIAELIGPLGIEIDRSLRLLDVAKAVPEMIDNMSDDTRSWVENFLIGLNTAITHCPEQPHECKILGIQAKPWTMTDLITLARINSADISWLLWLKLLKVRHKLPSAQWRELWPKLAGADGPSGYGSEGPFGVQHILARQTRSGSNSSAISGARMANGHAAIVSDPHLPIAIPTTGFFIGVKAPGLHLVGAMMSGLPFFLLGRNKHIAWGATNLHSQGSDLFDVSGLADHDIDVEEQVVKARWGKEHKIKIRRTEFGPIVTDGLVMKSDTPAALRWQGHQPSDEIGAMMAVANAQNWEEFHQALKPFAVTGLNMVFAGGEQQRAGHCIAAHLPRRPQQIQEDLIIPTSAARYWDQIADTRAMPTKIDTEQGFVVSANERPTESDFSIGYFFAPKDRSQRLTELFQANNPLTLADLQASQLDVKMPGVLALCQLLLQAAAHNPALPEDQEIIDLLAQWDGGYQAQRSEPLAFELLLGAVVKQLKLTPMAKHYHTVWLSYSGLFKELHALEPKQLASAVRSGLKVVRKKRKRLQSWGDVHRLQVDHLFQNLPLISRRYRACDLPANGGANSVNKSGHPLVTKKHKVSFGSCIRHISDLSDDDQNFFVMLGGQDGWIGSAHYADQIPLWQSGNYLQLPLKLETVKQTFRHLTELTPSKESGGDSIKSQ